jgi:hypothetical protein
MPLDAEDGARKVARRWVLKDVWGRSSRRREAGFPEREVARAQRCFTISSSRSCRRIIASVSNLQYVSKP